MLFYIIFLCAKAPEICIVHQIMLTKKRHRGDFLEAGVMKPLKFRDWLTWEHKVLITLQELQKEGRNDSEDYFNMVNLVGKGKLIEANNTYINTYVLFPTTLDDLFYLW